MYVPSLVSTYQISTYFGHSLAKLLREEDMQVCTVNELHALRAPGLGGPHLGIHDTSVPHAAKFRSFVTEKGKLSTKISRRPDSFLSCWCGRSSLHSFKQGNNKIFVLTQ